MAWLAMDVKGTILDYHNPSSSHSTDLTNVLKKKGGGGKEEVQKAILLMNVILSQGAVEGLLSYNLQ